MFTTGPVNLYTGDIEAGVRRNALLRDPGGNLVEIVAKVRRAS